MIEYQRQKEEMQKKVNEAAQLLSKANNGDMEAKAEVIQWINAEQGRKERV